MSLFACLQIVFDYAPAVLVLVLVLTFFQVLPLHFHQHHLPQSPSLWVKWKPAAILVHQLQIIWYSLNPKQYLHCILAAKEIITSVHCNDRKTSPRFNVSVHFLTKIMGHFTIKDKANVLPLTIGIIRINRFFVLSPAEILLCQFEKLLGPWIVPQVHLRYVGTFPALLSYLH